MRLKFLIYHKVNRKSGYKQNVHFSTENTFSMLSPFQPNTKCIPSKQKFSEERQFYDIFSCFHLLYHKKKNNSANSITLDSLRILSIQHMKVITFYSFTMPNAGNINIYLQRHKIALIKSSGSTSSSENAAQLLSNEHTFKLSSTRQLHLPMTSSKLPAFIATHKNNRNVINMQANRTHT